MRLVYLVCALAFANVSLAQNDRGQIEFERRTYWIEIMSSLPYMTQEEIDRDRLTWGKNQGRPQPHILYFNKDESLYTFVEQENEYGYSWKKDKFMLIRDHKTQTSEDYLDMLGKTYIIEGAVPKRKWKILNEIMEIAGYLCMKAETYDPIKDQTIHAWFTNQIPVRSGPEGFDGLPGMILGLDINEGCLTVFATKVSLDGEESGIPKPEKMKGKRINRSEYNEKLTKWITESIEGEKNPYWQVRY